MVTFQRILWRKLQRPYVFDYCKDLYTIYLCKPLYNNYVITDSPREQHILPVLLSACLKTAGCHSLGSKFDPRGTALMDKLKRHPHGGELMVD